MSCGKVAGCQDHKLQIWPLFTMKGIVASVNYHGSFCQESSWCYQLRSLLTGLPASSLVPHSVLNPAAGMILFNHKSDNVTSSHAGEKPGSSQWSTEHPHHHLSGLIFSCTAHVTLDTLASDLHRMLALEAPQLLISKSKLSPQSLLKCHPPPI